MPMDSSKLIVTRMALGHEWGKRLGAKKEGKIGVSRGNSNQNVLHIGMEFLKKYLLKFIFKKK